MSDIRYHAWGYIGWIRQKGAQKAYRPELEGESQADMVLAASRYERLISVIQIKETRQLVGGGLAGIAAVAPRLVVREKCNRHPSSLIKKGEANTRQGTIEK
jgi:hypothetical protein